MPNWSTRSKWFRQIAAMSIVLAAAIVRFAFLGKLGLSIPFLTFYPAVMIAALYYGLSGGILATLLSAAMVSFFWLEPVGSFRIASFSDLLGMLVFLMSCMMISFIAEAMHRAQARAVEAETRRNRVTQELLQKEKLFRALFEQAGDGIFFLDTAGKVISVNESYARLHGYTVEEVLQLGLDELDVEGRAHARDRLRRIMAGESLTFEVEHRHKDGHIFPLEVTTNLISAENEPLIIAIHRDITERKRAEDELRRERALLRCILDSTTDLIFIKDRNSVYLGCNKASEKFIGLPENEQIGKTDLDFFDQEMGRLIREIDRQVIEEGKTLRTEEWVTYPDGRRVLLDTLKVPFYGPDGAIQGLVGNCRDITERKQAEEKLAKLNEELDRRVCERTALLQRKTEELELANERLKEVDRLKSRFIASMSHELRTPLNSVIGFSSVLLNEWVGPANTEQKQNLASILSSGRHLLNMINDILDVSQIEAGTIKPVIEEFDLHDLLIDAQSQVTAALREKGLELRSELLRKRMRTDRRRLLQCVLNILSNAAKFTDQGSVTVAARIVALSGETPEAEMVEIVVTDTGIGIGAEDLSRICQPFFRIVTPRRAVVPGTGLGLYLTGKIAQEILKGDLLVSSEYGKGSRFSLRIPARLPGTKPLQELPDEDFSA